jgi:hydroxymethylpyrimidine/phosphomethylpyrimidine kinase
MRPATTPPVVLTVGASDSLGGTGIQGDVRTLAALRVHGASTVTAVFAQNTRGIHDMYPMPANVVSGQLTAVVSDVAMAAVKTGAFVTPDACAVVTARARAGALPNLIVDPVLTAAEGSRKGLIAALERLLPHALMVTPNREEASELLGWQVATQADMAGAAAQLAAGGPRYVVITGGDVVVGDEAVDALWADGSVRMLRAPRLAARNAYGSGSAFATAIAGWIALGESPTDAVVNAKSFVSRAIAGASDWHLGAGGGPIDHLGWSSRRAAA